MKQEAFTQELVQALQYSKPISRKTWQITKDIPDGLNEREAAQFFAGALEALFVTQFSKTNFSVCADQIRIGYNPVKKCLTAGVLICELPK